MDPVFVSPILHYLVYDYNTCNINHLSLTSIPGRVKRSDCPGKKPQRLREKDTYKKLLIIKSEQTAVDENNYR